MRCGGQPAQGKVKERAMERRPIKTIRNQVYQILKDDICEGRFAPGQWLQENELAERLCVSRSPIREALRQLASDGLVVEIPNKGVFVKSLPRGTLRKFLTCAFCWKITPSASCSTT